MSVEERFKKLWKERTGKEWQPATASPNCRYMQRTNKLFIPSRPCRGYRVICNNPACPGYRAELPPNHCKADSCKYYQPSNIDKTD